jgi:hypothetical protein
VRALPDLIADTEAASKARSISVSILKSRVLDVALETALQLRCRELELEQELARTQNLITSLRVATFRELGDDPRMATLVGWCDPQRARADFLQDEKEIERSISEMRPAIGALFTNPATPIV